MASLMRTRAQLQAEIEERFGFFPALFAPALVTPDVLESLWQQTRTAFIDNPLLPTAKAILCVWLLRDCAAAHSLIAGHSHALRPASLSEKAVETWLMTPWPAEADLPDVRAALDAAEPLSRWPEPQTPLGQDALRAAALLFLHPVSSGSLRAPLRRVIGPETFGHLLSLLSYLAACVIWGQSADGEDAALPSSRQQFQGRRQESEQVARATLDGLSAHIAIVDAAGCIVAVNRAWQQFAAANSPMSGGVCEGSNYLEVCEGTSGDCSDEARQTADGIRAVLAGDTELFTLEYPCHSPTEERWFLLRVTRFPGDGPSRAVVSHENITHRRHAEDSLRRRVAELANMTALLERKNQELDHFAYITSHDLKAPLRGIANLSRWIEEDLGDGISGETTEHLRLLRGRVSRMEAMIDGILQYSRIDRVKINSETVDVGELLKAVVDLLDPQPPFQVLMESPMPTINAQRVRLEQVFLNLIGNAMKHHDRPDGHIHISVSDQGSRWEFVVADDGPGIAPQYHDKIFQMFQTLEPRDKVEGTGVGLAVVKKIVEGQGGSITLDSQEGAGATFRFTWPKRPPERLPGHF